MSDERSRKPWILFLAVMAFLGAASLSTGDSVEATREETEFVEDALADTETVELTAADDVVIEEPEEPEEEAQKPGMDYDNYTPISALNTISSDWMLLARVSKKSNVRTF